MNEKYCNREEEIAGAVAQGSADAEILRHAQSCAVCSEILLVTGVLRESSELSAQEAECMPGAPAVWRKAQARAREKALERATLSIRVARIVACVAVAVAVPFVTFQFQWSWPQIADVWFGNFAAASWLWPRLTATLLLLSAIVAFSFIALGSWYMLREE